MGLKQNDMLEEDGSQVQAYCGDLGQEKSAFWHVNNCVLIYV